MGQRVRVHRPLMLRTIQSARIGADLVEPDVAYQLLVRMLEEFQADTQRCIASGQVRRIVDAALDGPTRWPSRSGNSLGRALGIVPVLLTPWAAYNRQEMIRQRVVDVLPAWITRQRIWSLRDEGPVERIRNVMTARFDETVYGSQIRRVLRSAYPGIPVMRPVLPLWAADGHFASKPTVEDGSISFAMMTPEGRLHLTYRLPVRAQIWPGVWRRPTIRLDEDGQVWVRLVTQRHIELGGAFDRRVVVGWSAASLIGFQLAVLGDNGWQFGERFSMAGVSRRNGYMQTDDIQLRRQRLFPLVNRVVQYAKRQQAQLCIGLLDRNRAKDWVDGQWVLERIRETAHREGVAYQMVNLVPGNVLRERICGTIQSWK